MYKACLLTRLVAMESTQDVYSRKREKAALLQTRDGLEAITPRRLLPLAGAFQTHAGLHLRALKRINKTPGENGTTTSQMGGNEEC